MGEEQAKPAPEKRYQVMQATEAPKICPLINSCQQIRADREEYARLSKKWTDYAKSQPPEELDLESRVRIDGKIEVKREKVLLDRVQPIIGTQVFYLEYGRTEKKKARFMQMCPHFKRDVLGFATSDPPYHDCITFSEWFYSRKKS